MRKSLLLVPATLIFAMSSEAQQPGMWRGRTSQNADIAFTVTSDGLCVNPMSFGATLDCPSGGRTGWGAFYGLCSPIEKGSFTVRLAPVDGAIPTYEVPGTFTSDTTAEGTISFQASHLYVVPGEDLAAQLCDSGNVTWTAAPGASEAPRFEGNQVVTGKPGTQVILNH